MEMEINPCFTPTNSIVSLFPSIYMTPLERERGDMKMASDCVGAMTGFWVVFLVLLRLSCSEGQMVPALFVFGDSLMDVGNNNALPFSVVKAVLPYYGVDFPTKKPNGRFSNGKNSADFIAEKLGLPTSPPYVSLNSSQSNSSSPFLTGVSFASSGAGIFDSTDEKLKQAFPLKDQVEFYRLVHDDLVKHMGSSGAQKHVAKSLFVVGIGSNDIFDYTMSSDLRNQYTPQQFVDLMVSLLKDNIKRIYSYDARKFVFVGFPPIGCTPQQRAGNKKEPGECNEDTNSWSRMYNEALQAMVKGLKSELGDISYSYLDVYNVVLGFIQNPSAYGFTEVKAACCGLGDLRAQIPCLPVSQLCSNRTDHLFFDLVHPTEATDRILIDTVFRGSPQYTYPMGVQQLAAVET